METISAKEILNIYKLRRQRLIDIVRSGKVTIYDEDDRIVSLQQHQRTFEERVFDYTPVDIQGYLDAFDFGSSPIEEVKQDIIKYENKKVEKATTEVEYNLIVENYYFGEIEFDKVYKEMYLSNRQPETITNLDQALAIPECEITESKLYDVYKNWWQGKTLENAYSCMEEKRCPKEVIIKVLMGFDGATQFSVGKLFYSEDDTPERLSIERMVRRNIKSKKYKINYVDKIK